jgi:hypothetical protein
LRGPGWGGALFRGLTRPGVIRYFLRRSWGADQIDEDLCQYCVLTTRQRGAGFAPRTNWSFTVFETGAMPCYEAGRRFTDEYQAFLGSIGTQRRRESSGGKDASIRERNRE